MSNYEQQASPPSNEFLGLIHKATISELNAMARAVDVDDRDLCLAVDRLLSYDDRLVSSEQLYDEYKIELVVEKLEQPYGEA